MSYFPSTLNSPQRICVYTAGTDVDLGNHMCFRGLNCAKSAVVVVLAPADTYLRPEVRWEWMYLAYNLALMGQWL